MVDHHKRDATGTRESAGDREWGIMAAPVVPSPTILSTGPGVIPFEDVPPAVLFWGSAGTLTIDTPSKEGSMNTAPRCDACGMPMSRPSQHGNGDTSSRFCIYCTDLAGNLKPRSEIREGMIQYTMKLESWPREQAEAAVDQQMSQLPAWKMKQARSAAY